ncbi:unnamed protein product, partial [marine sediment metagenome]
WTKKMIKQKLCGRQSGVVMLVRTEESIVG